MKIPKAKEQIVGILVFSGFLFLGLFILENYDYLLFHTVAELFSIIIACCIFIIGWNTRKIANDDFFVVLGILTACTAIIDIFHTLTYSGIHIFPFSGANFPTQFWIAARYFQASGYCLAFISRDRRLNLWLVITGAFAITIILVVLIFAGHFPESYEEGVGLTDFKILSEYIIIAIFILSIIFIYKKQEEFQRTSWVFLVVSIGLLIVSEFSFTLYFDPFDFANFIGHFFRFLSYYALYRALIQNTLVNPTRILFNQLKRNEKTLNRKIRRIEKKLSSAMTIRERAEINSAAKTLLLANVSHELRTPLNAIMGFSDLLLAGFGGLSWTNKGNMCHKLVNVAKTSCF